MLPQIDKHENSVRSLWLCCSYPEEQQHCLSESAGTSYRRVAARLSVVTGDVLMLKGEDWWFWVLCLLREMKPFDRLIPLFTKLKSSAINFKQLSKSHKLNHWVLYWGHVVNWLVFWKTLTTGHLNAWNLPYRMCKELGGQKRGENARRLSMVVTLRRVEAEDGVAAH